MADSTIPSLATTVHVRKTAEDMKPFESASVIEGTRTATVLPLFQGGSEGNQFRAAFWTTTPCTIRIQQPLDTVIYVVRGAAEIEFEGGDMVNVVAGDVLAVPKGAWSTWTFTEDFEEFVVYAG